MGVSGCLQAGVIVHAEPAGWEVMAPSHSCCKRVNTTTAEKSCSFQHKIFFHLFKLAQFKKIRFSLESNPSLTSFPYFYGKLGWSICFPVCVSAMPGWDFNYRKTAERTPMLHGKCMECWHLPAKGFMSLLDRNALIYIPKIHSHMHNSQPKQGLSSAWHKHEDPELSLHHETAAWVSCSLNASSSGPVQGVSHHPGGKRCILNLSKTSRD